MKKLIFFSWLLCCLNIMLYSQWLPKASLNWGFQGIFFTSVATGFAGGDQRIGKTTNGGNTFNWIIVEGTNFVNIVEIAFLDNNTGFALGSHFSNGGYIYKTTNAGASWSRKYTDADFVYQIACFPAAIYVSGGHGSFLISTNAGENWQKTFLPDTNSFIGMSFINQSTGFLGGNFEATTNEKILKTTNGGVNWSFLPGNFDNIIQVAFLSENTGYMAKSYAVLKTTNGGTNWNLMYDQIPYPIHNMKFLNPSVGWLAGGSTNSDGGRIHVTTNGGANWKIQLKTGFDGDRFFDLYVSDTVCASTAQVSERLFTTTNGGGIFPSVSGTVRYSDNNQPVSSGGHVKALRYDEALNKIITVDSTGILPDGSYFLDSLPPIPLDFMGYQDDELDFVPTYYDTTIYWRNAIALTPSGNMENIDIKVKRINNSGSGMRHISGYVNGLQDAPIVNLDNAYIYATSGSQFKNYGVSMLNGYFIVDSLLDGSYTLIIDRMGYYTTIMNITLSGTNIDNLNIEMNKILGFVNGNEIVSDFSLLQNYPNPFNPTTEIIYNLPQNTFVTLRIYDVTGKLVLTLINDEYMMKGYHEIKFDGNNHASGIYFYIIEAGDYTGSKKMVLLK